MTAPDPTPRDRAVRDALIAVIDAPLNEVGPRRIALRGILGVAGGVDGAIVADALIAALSPPAEPREAVYGWAYRVRYEGGTFGPWNFNDSAEFVGDLPDFYEIIPLYRHPAVGTAGRERDEAILLVQELVDGGACRYDHHGYCQTHALDPKPCPHERARDLLARVAATPPDAERCRDCLNIGGHLPSCARYHEQFQIAHRIADLERDVMSDVWEAGRAFGRRESRPAPAGASVTEEMVERGARALFDEHQKPSPADNPHEVESWDDIWEPTRARYLHNSRVTLTAALAAPTHGTTADTERLDWLADNLMREDNDYGAGIAIERYEAHSEVVLRQWGEVPSDGAGEPEFNKRFFAESRHPNIRAAIDAARSGTTEETR